VQELYKQHIEQMVRLPTRAHPVDAVYQSRTVPWAQRITVATMEPICAQMSLDEKPFGTEDHRSFTVRKGMKQTLLFHERFMQVNAGPMGAWDIVLFKS